MKISYGQWLPHHDAPFFRRLHILVAVLILSQIINSNFTAREALGEHSLETLITWLHILSGLLLIAAGVIMLIWMLVQRGFRWYFAWLTLDFRGIRNDVVQLTGLKLPQAQGGGIAATVQGLGVIALIAVACSGGLWFLFNSTSLATPDLTRRVLHWHKFLTTFVEIYFYSHGSMGVLHILLSRYEK
ncbi:cytochrome b/b6 domain-containing protein [Pantoea ananatis]